MNNNEGQMFNTLNFENLPASPASCTVSEIIKEEECSCSDHYLSLILKIALFTRSQCLIFHGGSVRCRRVARRHSPADLAGHYFCGLQKFGKIAKLLNFSILLF